MASTVLRRLFFVALISLHGLAHAALKLDGTTAEVRLNSCVSVLENADGKMGIADVLQASQTTRFTKVKSEKVIHLGITQSAWWLRCDLNLALSTDRGKLEAGAPHLDHLDLYYVRDGQVVAHYTSGDMRSFSQRPIASNRFIFPLPDENGTTTLLVRVQSSSLVVVPLRWLSNSEYEQVTDLDLIVFSAYLGMLFALFTYNLFLFAAVRAWSFLHYIVSTLAYSLATASVLGFTPRYLWPEMPGFNNIAVIIALLVSSIFGLLFAASFFSTHRRTPKIHHWLLMLIAVETAGIPMAFASTQAGEILLALVGNIGVILLLTIIVQGIRGKVPGAVPFLVAIIAQLLVSFSQVAQSAGISGTEYWSTYSMQLGSACMVMFFALGIAVRLNAIKLARNKAQQEALTAQQLLVESLRENERILESRVQERTQELAEVNTVLRRREQQLVDLLHHDTLTGAATRILFEDRLSQAMARCARNQNLVALLLIDLDGFKALNDNHGHDAGDAVLVEITRRFKNVLRGSDTVGRLGGDEFVLIVDDLKTTESVTGIADKILLEAAQPVTYKDQVLQVGASIGIAFVPLDANEMNALLKAADHAMYAAKAAGKGCWRMAGNPDSAPAAC